LEEQSRGAFHRGIDTNSAHHEPEREHVVGISWFVDDIGLSYERFIDSEALARFISDEGIARVGIERSYSAHHASASDESDDGLDRSEDFEAGSREIPLEPRPVESRPAIVAAAPRPSSMEGAKTGRCSRD
jgi:hypothetical protein